MFIKKYFIFKSTFTKLSNMLILKSHIVSGHKWSLLPLISLLSPLSD
jgi:hypothetical protein